MAHSMLHKAQSAVFGAAKVAPRRARAAPTCNAAPKFFDVKVAKLQPVLLASVLALNGGMMVSDAMTPPYAFADEEVSEENLTPYQKKQLEFKKRMELLKQARDKALQTGGLVSTEDGDATPAPAPAPPPAPMLSMPAPKPAPTPAPVPAPAPPPIFKSAPVPPPAPKPAAPKVEAPAEKSWWEAASEPAAAPAVKAPAPKPAPAKVEVKAAPAPAKQEVNTTTSGKRRGPLPMWLAQVILMGAYGGLGLALTKYNAETSALLKQATEKGLELYGQAEKKITASMGTK